MGFADYFLIVWDFIAFAKRSGISVGPGRGSTAGSLVAYCLEITDVDPMKYDLLFERFLNPGRKSMPDIDIDFCRRTRRGASPTSPTNTARPRRADHHVRDDGGARRRARRGACARDSLRRRRQDREGHPRRAGADARCLPQAGAGAATRSTTTTGGQRIIDLARTLEGIIRQTTSTRPASSSPTAPSSTTFRSSAKALILKS